MKKYQICKKHESILRWQPFSATFSLLLHIMPVIKNILSSFWNWKLPLYIKIKCFPMIRWRWKIVKTQRTQHTLQNFAMKWAGNPFLTKKDFFKWFNVSFFNLIFDHMSSKKSYLLNIFDSKSGKENSFLKILERLEIVWRNYCFHFYRMFLITAWISNQIDLPVSREKNFWVCRATLQFNINLPQNKKIMWLKY